jgi:hypothetical protein
MYCGFLEPQKPRSHMNRMLTRSLAAAATNPYALAPSVEEAYRRKCIELRKRMQDVEENNDITRQRRARLIRGIKKMRIERAILLETLAKRMRKNGSGGIYDDDSEDSTESPPTVRPLLL